MLKSKTGKRFSQKLRYAQVTSNRGLRRQPTGIVKYYRRNKIHNFAKLQ